MPKDYGRAIRLYSCAQLDTYLSSYLDYASSQNTKFGVRFVFIRSKTSSTVLNSFIRVLERI